MTLTFKLSPDRETALRAQAEAQGMTVEQWLLNLVEQQIPSTSIAHLQKTDPQEWARQVHEWAASHDRTSRPLSDEAISRESIYPDRF